MKQPGAEHRDRRSYTVEAVARACSLLHAFRDEQEILHLRDLVGRTRINKTTVFRILCTLENAGLIEVLGPGRYRTRIKPVKRRALRLAYASQMECNLFVQDVTEGIRRRAAEEGIDLLEFDNRCSPKVAIQNARLAIEAGVDLAIEYQIHDHVAPAISSMFHEAHIPLIAITVPHPGAVFYGPNGYEVGRTAGRALGQWVKQKWNAVVDQVLLLEVPSAGPLPHSRLSGVVTGIQEVLEGISESQVMHVDGRGQFGPSLEATRKYLRFRSARRILISAVNDASVLGALRAFEEAGRLSDCVAVGQGGSFEARVELRRPNTRMLGTVALFPEKYGQGVLRLALDILNHRPVPPAVFVKHCLITSQNVNQYYPNDSLAGAEDVETFLLRSP
jgi:ribose transport system substrate-binding protein